jgi:hypothetical protein
MTARFRGAYKRFSVGYQRVGLAGGCEAALEVRRAVARRIAGRYLGRRFCIQAINQAGNGWPKKQEKQNGAADAENEHVQDRLPCPNPYGHDCREDEQDAETELRTWHVLQSPAKPVDNMGKEGPKKTVDRGPRRLSQATSLASLGHPMSTN